MNPEKLLAAIVLVSLTFGAGLQVDRGHFKDILKNVGLLGRALAANFIIVPALGVLLAMLFRLPPHVETGFLLMAIAPGVPFVLTSVRKRGGRLALAVELAIFLPVISIATVPITAALVLPPGDARLPIGQFAMTLVLFQLLPLLIGIVVGGRLPALASRLVRPVQILFFVAVLALLALLFPRVIRDLTLVYGSLGMLASLCLVLSSMGIGWLFGGPEREDRRVLGIGTTLRNVGLCALVATTTFRGETVAATVLSYFLIQFIVTTLFGVYFTRTAQRAPA